MKLPANLRECHLPLLATSRRNYFQGSALLLYLSSYLLGVPCVKGFPSTYDYFVCVSTDFSQNSPMAYLNVDQVLNLSSKRKVTLLSKSQQIEP